MPLMNLEERPVPNENVEHDALAPVPPENVREEVFARLYGEPLGTCPENLFIPPEALKVFLESFEGPLDFLLYLIRRQRFDIFDIPMAELTEQYVRYVDWVRESHLDLAAAYLVMSATLMQIKSRLLLPPRTNPETGEEEDPRAALREKLLIYEGIRRAAEALGELPVRDWDYLVPEVPAEEKGPLPPAQADVSDLSSAWLDILSRRSLAAHHRVSRQELSIRAHMRDVLMRLRATGRITFSELLREGDVDHGRENVAVWFLAVLELAKEGLVKLSQKEKYGDILVTVPDESKTDLPAEGPFAEKVFD